METSSYITLVWDEILYAVVGFVCCLSQKIGACLRKKWLGRNEDGKKARTRYANFGIRSMARQ